jgi:hypothetical protein
MYFITIYNLDIRDDYKRGKDACRLYPIADEDTLS